MNELKSFTQSKCLANEEVKDGIHCRKQCLSSKTWLDFHRAIEVGLC